MTPAPTAPCSHCTAGPTCLAIARRMGRYCELADPSHPDHQPDIYPILRGEPHPWYARNGVSPPEAAGPAPAVEVDPVVVAVELCDFRYSSCGCLGKPAECRQAGYPSLVTIDDCRACLAR